MNKDSKIYVAGHSGMVGTALMRRLQEDGYTNIVTRQPEELNLMRQADTEMFFASEKPEYVFLAAARVGGVGEVRAFPAEFIYENLTIELNFINAAYKYGVQKLLFLSSVHVYPECAETPLKEKCLLSGALESNQEPYVFAKLAGIKLCEFYSRQYGVTFFSVILCNIYGSGGNATQVIPMLCEKFGTAVACGDENVTIWGSGSARREFMHVTDCADALVFLMNNYSENVPINVGSGDDISIKSLAEQIKNASGYKGGLFFDSAKPEGAVSRVLDTSRLRALGWQSRVSFEDGICDLFADRSDRK